MSWQDIVQGCYEALAGLAILGNCVTLYRDKQVRGVSVTTTAFFTSWGYWNLYYFPHLHQWMAFTGGILVVAANTTWVGMMVYYLRRERRDPYQRAAKIMMEAARTAESVADYVAKTDPSYRDEPLLTGAWQDGIGGKVPPP